MKFETLSDFQNGFDDVIDVRSPAEYEQDHVPGSINLPVLSNEERARVGTLYVQDSPFRARKLGGALVVRNIARHLEDVLHDRPKAWRPLVYCWRGGQRSGSMTWMLSQVGWKAAQLPGGYKSYRAIVKSALYDRPLGRKVILLDGNTGTAKTEILHVLAARGLNVLDLEGLANHRGSVFGKMPDPQPSQRMFERNITTALDAMPEGPVLIEAESSKVGDRLVPPSLWTAMQAAPRIRIEASLKARSVYLARAYGDILADVKAVRATLARLTPLIGHKAASEWGTLCADRDHEGFTSALMQFHYDPRYEKSRGRAEPVLLGRVKANRFDRADIEQIADKVEVLFRGYV